jgi:hypothetical protein
MLVWIATPALAGGARESKPTYLPDLATPHVRPVRVSGRASFVLILYRGNQLEARELLEMY